MIKLGKLGVYTFKKKSCPTLCNPMDYTIQSIEFSRQEYWSEQQQLFFAGKLLNPGIKPRSHALRADSLPAEPQGNPQNSGMRSLSLLQQIFRIQESNQDLLHCCRILYQLSYQGTLRRNHPSLKKSTEISNKVGSMHAQSLIRV